MQRSNLAIRLIIFVLAVCSLSPQVRAQSADDFFQGKQISLIIGYNPGGSYDLYSRLAAGALSRYIPGNPSIVARNMPGVGSVKAANYLAHQAPRDGLTIGMIGQALAVTQVLREPSVDYDLRTFNWLGRFTAAVEVTEVWHTSPTKTIADAMKRETMLAATSAGSTTDVMPRLMNKIAGTKFKIVRGYAGTNGGVLAMERGEVEGSHDTVDSLMFKRKDWLRDKTVSVLVQYALHRHALLPAVPTMVEFGKTSEDRQLMALYGSTAEVGRALMAPPGVPADRVAMLRKAFAAMVADPAFQQEVEKHNMEFAPMSGEALQKLIVETLDLPSAVISRAVALSRE